MSTQKLLMLPKIALTNSRIVQKLIKKLLTKFMIERKHANAAQAPVASYTLRSRPNAKYCKLLHSY